MNGVLPAARRCMYSDISRMYIVEMYRSSCTDPADDWHFSMG